MLSITLKQLEIFITVAETRSFSKAGALLSFSQPAISSNISLLEETVGAELFDRNNKKSVTLTEAGRLFYSRAKEAVSSCYLLQDTVQSSVSDDTIAIGAHHIPARYILPDVMAMYRQTNPAARFLLKEGEDSEILDVLNLQKIHLAFVTTDAIPSGCKSRSFYNDELVLGLPNTPRFQQLLEDIPDIRDILASEPFVWIQEMDGEIMEYLSQIGMSKSDLNIVAELSSVLLAKNAVIEGLGISLLSRISLKCALKSAEILSVSLEGAPCRSIQIVSKVKSQLNSAEREFLRFMSSNSFDFEKCNH